MMNKKYSILLFLFSLVATPLIAQVESNSSKKYFARLETLFEEGRKCYVGIGNKYQLKRVIDAYEVAFNQARTDGIITLEDENSLMLQVKLDKLWGDYHYLNSDEDSLSYEQAEKHFQDALAITEASDIGQESFYYRFVIHEELAQLYYKQGRYVEANKEMEHAFEYSNYLYNLPDSDNAILDFISQQAMCKARVSRFNEAINDINAVISNYRNTDSERYGEALRKKAKILMLQQESGDTGMADPTEDALKCYKEFFSLKKEDALLHFEAMSSEEREQYWMRIRPFVVDCYRLEGADPAFLYDVTLFSKALLLELNRDGGGRQNLEADWQDIQKQLQPKDCAIEFIQYEKYGKQKMAALVLNNHEVPKFVRMASPDSVMQYNIGASSIQERLTYVRDIKTNKQKTNRIYEDSTGFFRLIWRPQLIEAIGDSRDIWFAPDGYQHRIAIEYLLPEAAANYRCHRLTSTRTLLRRDKTGKAQKSDGNALIIGGVNYNSSQYYTEMQNDSVAYTFFKEDKFLLDSLKYSLPEVNAILHCRNNPQDLLLCGVEAAEFTFRDLCKGYSLIHISSHGAYRAASVPLGTDLKPCMTDQSLSECLIAFSGINTSLKTPHFNPTSIDGLLSAKEISSLDLSQTELVVLNCCETGLGGVTADGVYGIQRGLKNAGAQTMILTLWDVLETSSVFFMTNFYDQMSQGYSIYEAFYHVRELMTKHEEYNEPRCRDPFILIDAL